MLITENQNWYALSEEESLHALDTSLNEGLSAETVAQRKAQFGENIITQKKGESPLLIFLKEFNQPLIYILLGSSVITALLQEWIDSAVIMGVVLANAFIGFFQEMKALKAIESLSKIMNDEATVIRDGKKQRISVRELTVGDVVLLQSGDKVPADLRLIEVRELQIDEAALTGESVASSKELQGLKDNTVLGDRKNMAFSSTLVTYGTGKGIVTAIGNQTQIGQINQMIASADVLATPLTKQLAQFSALLLYVILGLAAITFVVGILRGETALNMFMAAVALAVGAIPEGLPAAMTIILAIGVSKMAQRNAIIRKLPAVETLGSTSVICSDKTGTLTQNQMTVQVIFVDKDSIEVSGVGYEPQGAFSHQQQSLSPASHKALLTCLEAGLLCNEATLKHNEEHQWHIEGDPTEGALLVAAQKAGLSEKDLEQLKPRLDTIPFESQHQYMATLHQTDAEQSNTLYLKGSVESILARCNKVMHADGTLNEINSEFYHQKADALASEGLRVLAFAMKTLPKQQEKISHQDVTEGLVFLGLQAMIDPPRPEAMAAVKACHEAGIEVKMITGDHALTALAIAQKIGILPTTPPTEGTEAVLKGKEITQLDDKALERYAANINVFARVSPEDKLRLVKALQVHEHIIAMTGDGVNDAPSLRQANIGISMGITGTDVAKETADMILTDDNFATIAAAVEEGRGVYDNLIKFITWTLPTNFGEGMIILVAVMLGATLPILPVQILWINMTTAVLLGLTLAFEPKEPNIMQRPPRSPKAKILSLPLIIRISLVGMLLCLCAFIFFDIALSNGETKEVARTIAVNIFVFGEIFYLFNCRSLRYNMFKLGLFTNMWVLGGIGIMVVLQLLYTYAPFMQVAFQSAALGLVDWVYIVGVGILIYVLVEIEKYFTFRSLQRRGKKLVG